MTERLKEELRHLGDGAPELRVPDDAWRRGRRARHRDHLLTGLLVASIVVLAGSLIRLTPAERLATDVLAPRPETARVGLPERLYAVPQRLYGLPDGGTAAYAWDDGVGENDLAVGPAVVAYTAGDSGGLPVVVTSDGGYHPLNLPGFSGAAATNNESGDTPLSLSPDGRFLAYAWWDPTAPADGPMPAGLRVVDLTTGSLRSLSLEADDGVDVDQITWSPDSAWLAWAGQSLISWSATNRAFETPVAGRVAVPTAQTRLVNESITMLDEQQPWDVGVTNQGRVVLWSGQTLAFWDGGEVRPVPSGANTKRDQTAPPLAVSRKNHVALSPGTGRTPGIRVLSVSARTDEPWQPAGLVLVPDDTRTLSAVGWLSDDLLLTLASPVAASGGSPWLGLGARGSDAARPEAVAEVERGIRSLTVATDLVDPDAPTVDYPEPSWPWSTSDKVLLALGVALVAGLGLAFVVRRRRLP